MASTATASDVSTPVAPWWHTALVLLILGATSAASAHFRNLPRVPVGGISPRMRGYITALAIEWLLVLVIWIALRRRGMRIRDLVSARWTKGIFFLRDLGLAVAFLVVATPSLQLLSRLLHANFNAGAMLPTSGVELMVWLLLAASAGFSEELTFRGYLNRQFSAWSGSQLLGVGLQGLAFGLAHGYQGWRMMTLITIFGWMFGALAVWRKSLAPGMLAHGIQDSAGGILGFLAHR